MPIISQTPFFTSISYLEGKQLNFRQQVFEWVENYFPSNEQAVISPLRNDRSITFSVRTRSLSPFARCSYYTLVIPLLIAITKIFARIIFHLYHWCQKPSLVQKFENSGIETIDNVPPLGIRQKSPKESQPLDLRQESTDRSEGNSTTLVEPLENVPPLPVVWVRWGGTGFDVRRDERCSAFYARVFQRYATFRGYFGAGFKDLRIKVDGVVMDPTKTMGSYVPYTEKIIQVHLADPGLAIGDLLPSDKHNQLQAVIDRADLICRQHLGFPRDYPDGTTWGLQTVLKESQVLSKDLESWMKELITLSVDQGIKDDALLVAQNLKDTLTDVSLNMQQEIAQLTPLIDPFLPSVLTDIVLDYLPFYRSV